jgi:hypothetical protein
LRLADSDVTKRDIENAEKVLSLFEKEEFMGIFDPKCLLISL